MYEFSNFSSLIIFLAVLGFVYILIKWLQGRKKDRQDGQEDGQNELM
jgi:hypothetical protein